MPKQAKAKQPKMKTKPIIEIDFKVLDVLCAAQCTAEEIATYMKVSVDTLGRRIQEAHGIGFAEYFKQKRGAGLASLRSSQFKLAKTNASMAIFLGKNYLGQADIPTGGEAPPMDIVMKPKRLADGDA